MRRSAHILKLSWGQVLLSDEQYILMDWIHGNMDIDEHMSILHGNPIPRDLLNHDTNIPDIDRVRVMFRTIITSGIYDTKYRDILNLYSEYVIKNNLWETILRDNEI